MPDNLKTFLHEQMSNAPGIAEAAEKADEVFELGVRVVMHSLASRADLNGRHGVVCGLPNQGGRVPVKVGSDMLALKAACIKKAAYPEEPVLNVHATETFALLTDVPRKHLAKMHKSTMCIFEGKGTATPHGHK